jgi:hypothetical protein
MLPHTVKEGGFFFKYTWMEKKCFILLEGIFWFIYGVDKNAQK